MNTRIAVAGAGLIGREHIARIVAHPELELASIVDPMPAADELAAIHEVAHFADLDSMLAADKPDGLVIATPNQLHATMAKVAISAGLPILLEKPATTTVEEGEDLLALADALDARILVGHHRTHSPIMTLARQVVTSGRLGDIVAVNGTSLFYKPDDYFAVAPWRTQPGGGPVQINIIHEVHNYRIMCGDITSVYAATSSSTRHFAVEDTAAVIFTFASGAVGTLLLSDTAASPRSWEQTSGSDKHFDYHPDQDCYHLAGTMGSLSMPTMRLHTFPRAEDRSWWKPLDVERLSIPEIDPLAAQMDHFRAVIRGEAKPLCSLRDGLANVQVVDAILESARTRRPVELASRSS